MVKEFARTHQVPGFFLQRLLDMCMVFTTQTRKILPLSAIRLDTVMRKHFFPNDVDHQHALVMSIKDKVRIECEASGCQGGKVGSLTLFYKWLQQGRIQRRNRACQLSD